MKMPSHRALQVLGLLLPLALGVVLFTRGRGASATREMPLALERNDYARVRQLAPFVKDPNTRPRDGDTPLLAALEHGDLETAQLLVSRGADVNRRRSWGNVGNGSIVLESPLEVAITRGDVEAVRFLLEHGARVELRHVFTAQSGNAHNNSTLLRRRQHIAPLLERALDAR
jgi:ankyrin repeat protein